MIELIFAVVGVTSTVLVIAAALTVALHSRLYPARTADDVAFSNIVQFNYPQKEPK